MVLFFYIFLLKYSSTPCLTISETLLPVLDFSSKSLFFCFSENRIRIDSLCISSFFSDLLMYCPPDMKRAFLFFSGTRGTDCALEGYSIHPLPVCPVPCHVFDMLTSHFCIVMLHKYLRFIYCLIRVYPIYTLCITRYSIHFLSSTTYSIFTAIAPAFPSLEAVKLLCASLRSLRRFALAFRCSRLCLFRLERSNHIEC